MLSLKCISALRLPITPRSFSRQLKEEINQFTPDRLEAHTSLSRNLRDALGGKQPVGLAMKLVVAAAAAASGKDKADPALAKVRQRISEATKLLGAATVGECLSRWRGEMIHEFGAAAIAEPT